MTRQPIQVGSACFRTKGEAKQFVRELIGRYSDGEEIHGLDEVFLRDLLEMHPRADEKIGCGIAQFVVRLDPVWKRTKYPAVRRLDSTEVDWSWHKCLDGENSPEQAVFIALRRAVRWQIIEFKRTALLEGPRCPFRGIALDINNSHVDHAPPWTFLSLARTWTAHRIPALRRLDFEWELAEAEDLSSWQQFHAENATLRLVSAIANLSDVKLS
jgi:hypothetical protein